MPEYPEASWSPHSSKYHRMSDALKIRDDPVLSVRIYIETCQNVKGSRGAPRSSQKVPEAPRSSQKVPEAPRSSQRLPEAPNNSQRLPEAPKRSQRLPGAPRGPQRLPEAPEPPRGWRGLSDFFTGFRGISINIKAGSCQEAAATRPGNR